MGRSSPADGGRLNGDPAALAAAVDQWGTIDARFQRAGTLALILRGAE